MKNKKRSAEEIAEMRRQDYVTNKLLLVFAFAFVFLLYIMYLENSKNDFESFFALEGKIETSLWVSVGVLVAGIIWAVVDKFILKRDTECKLLTGMHLSIVGLFMTICMYDLNNGYMNALYPFTRLYVFIPIVVVLYIIYNSYQKEYFFISIASAFGGVAIWNTQDYIYGDPEKLAIVAAVAIAIVCAFTVWAQLGKGEIKLFGTDKKLRVFKPSARYALMYLSYALVIALLVAAFVVFDLTMYFLYGLVAYFVLIGVYYTIKLI